MEPTQEINVKCIDLTQGINIECGIKERCFQSFIHYEWGQEADETCKLRSSRKK